jgi:hypothetical protein
VQGAKKSGDGFGRHAPLRIVEVGRAGGATCEQPITGKRPGILFVGMAAKLGKGNWQREARSNPWQQPPFILQSRDRDLPAGEAEDPSIVHQKRGIIPTDAKQNQSGRSEFGKLRFDERQR